MSGPWQDWHPDISSALSYSRKKEIYVDVEFWRNNQPCLFAHKLVLSLWSPEFADHVKQRKDKKPIIIKFTEDIDVMEAVLQYLYSMNGTEPFYSRLPVKKLIQVLDITERLCLRHLHQKCLNSLLRKKIMPTNVVTIFDYGLRKNRDCTVRKCVQVFATQGVCESSLSTEVSWDVVRTILQLEKIFLESEAALLRLALSWLSCPQNVDYKYEVLSLLDLSSVECNEYQAVWRMFPKIFTSEERASILLAVSQQDHSKFPDWYKPKIFSFVEWNCRDLCVSIRRRLNVPGHHLLNFLGDQKDTIQAFDFSFKDPSAGRLEAIELNIGPMDIPESELTVKFNRYGSGQWRECRLDYARKINRYMLPFQEILKPNEWGSIYLKFSFLSSLKDNNIRYSMPNIIEKKKINDTLYEGSVKIKLKTSSLAFYCSSRNDPKYLVAAVYFNCCENHTAYLVRKPIKAKLNEFRNIKPNCIVPKIEMTSNIMIKKEEICIE